MRYISEITLTSDFLKYLLELGFPRESIVTEFRLFDKITKRAIYADIGIINPKTKDILLLIEIKNNENTALAAAQLARYLEATGNAFIQGAVVIPGKEFEKFQIYILDKENKTLKKEPPDFIYYLSIVNGYAAQKVDEIRKEEERAYDSFKVICIVLSVFSFFLLITDIVI